ncbi:hypothetical protein V9T40_009721 [Parthenolecanium corni]|uniref:Uncharacterized protein n=1 Tax=Parthenolecanium corni TaxID=536013 RepID=A0AAN9TNB9_9HEMI
MVKDPGRYAFGLTVSNYQTVDSFTFFMRNDTMLNCQEVGDKFGDDGLTLEKPGFTRLLKGPGGVIYDATRITSKDQVASYDTTNQVGYIFFKNSSSEVRLSSFINGYLEFENGIHQIDRSSTVDLSAVDTPQPKRRFRLPHLHVDVKRQPVVSVAAAITTAAPDTAVNGAMALVDDFGGRVATAGADNSDGWMDGWMVAKYRRPLRRHDDVNDQSSYHYHHRSDATTRKPQNHPTDH